jgi:hypothetical protein
MGGNASCSGDVLFAGESACQVFRGAWADIDSRIRSKIKGF